MSLISSIAFLTLISFSSSSENFPVATSSIGTPLILETILFKWSSLHISVSSIKTGIPLRALFNATLSAKTDFPIPGRADTRSTHFLRNPPPTTASKRGKPLDIPIWSHLFSIKNSRYSSMSSPSFSGFCPTSSSRRNSMIGFSTRPIISSILSSPLIEPTSFPILLAMRLAFLANSNFFICAAKCTTFSFLIGNSIKESMYSSSLLV